GRPREAQHERLVATHGRRLPRRDALQQARRVLTVAPEALGWLAGIRVAGPRIGRAEQPLDRAPDVLDLVDEDAGYQRGRRGDDLEDGGAGPRRIVGAQHPAPE